MICISISKSENISEALKLTPDLMEIRYDLIRKKSSFLDSSINSKTKQIATCRPGEYSEKERFEILKEAIKSGAAYVDVEVDSRPDYLSDIMILARKYSCQLIISYHNFTETPSFEDLKDILKSCYSLGADIAKIACFVNKKTDAARLLSLYAEEGRKVILGMGEMGRITRIAALKLGAEFTFVAPSEDSITAPGQLSYKEFVTLSNQI